LKWLHRCLYNIVIGLLLAGLGLSMVFTAAGCSYGNKEKEGEEVVTIPTDSPEVNNTENVDQNNDIDNTDTVPSDDPATNGDEKTDKQNGIEYTGTMTADNFTILYSTLGYEQKGTKKAFVRSLNHVLPEEVGNESSWVLLNTDNEIISQGSLVYRGLSYGIQLWEADFSSVENEGNYRLTAEINGTDGKQIYQEETLEFVIQNRIFTKNVLLPLTLYNAQARDAYPAKWGGFWDCHTKMSEAYSHGVFLYGLVKTLAYRGSSLTEEERNGLINACNNGFDYLMHLYDLGGDTGEFKHSDPYRYNADINQGTHNTIEALYGVAAYLHYFRDIDPERASQENYERACKSVAYLETVDSYYCYPYKEYQQPIYYYLYKFSGDETWKERGVEKLEWFLNNVNLRSMYRSGYRAVPLFEGLYLFATDFTDHPNHNEWISKAVAIKDKYYKDLEQRNAFGTIPISPYERTVDEWDNMWKMPAGESQYTWLINTSRASYAMDACYLGELTGDRSLEKLAAGELGYIMGINPGFPGINVANPESDKPLVAAAFIINLNARYNKGWFHWEFTPKNDKFMSIMNGIRIIDGEYVFKDGTYDDWTYGETFIKHDGAFAHAFCVYEDFVNKD
jgi:hypothetical protein